MLCLFQSRDVDMGSCITAGMSFGGEPKPPPEEIGVKDAEGCRHAKGISYQFVVEVDLDFANQPLTGDVGQLMVQAPGLWEIQPMAGSRLARNRLCRQGGMGSSVEQQDLTTGPPVHLPDQAPVDQARDGLATV